MAYATYQDVADRSFEDLSGNEALVTTRLADAEMLIKSRVSDLDSKVETGEVNEASVVYVECEMILRLLKNPEGYVQESDGGYSYMLNQNIAAGELRITDFEWSLLGLTSGAFVIRPMFDIPGMAGSGDGW